MLVSKFFKSKKIVRADLCHQSLRLLGLTPFSHQIFSIYYQNHSFTINMHRFALPFATSAKFKYRHYIRSCWLGYHGNTVKHTLLDLYGNN